jgi:hypothetical protein
MMAKTYCDEFFNVFGEGTNPFPEEFSKEIINVLAGISNPSKARDSDLEKLYNTFLDMQLTPFHLGLGNPSSDILFVGHENAGQDFNLPAKANPSQLADRGCKNSRYYIDLFVNEQILNYYLWLYKLAGIKIPPNCRYQDPEFASSFCHLYNSEKLGRHYWDNVNKAVGYSLP